MTHEPECGHSHPELYGHLGKCRCDILRAAYQRGRDYERKMIGLDRLADLAHSDEELEAAYLRGREDAAEAVRACEDIDWIGSAVFVDQDEAVAAARGELA